MRQLPTPSLRAILSIAVSLLLVPNICVAGGGGVGGKSSQTIRIKNTSTGVTSSPKTSIATVEVGDPGNDSLTVGSWSYGGVPDAFRIGKYEVTIAEYAAFLNAVATRPDIYSYGAAVIESLYDSRMGSDSNVAGITRSGQGNASSPYSYQVVGDGTRPITYVTLHNAARFANWMHNEALPGGDIESGAYYLYGEISASFGKNPSATWWIPSENEWFKAAYYKGGGISAGYYKFPTRSDTLPGNSSNSLSNQANFLRSGIYATTQISTLQTTENYLTPVGNFSNAPGPYGTYDQGGNVDEWTDTFIPTDYGIAYITRGGGWSTGGLNNDVEPVSTALPTDRSNKIGFRLARTATFSGPPTLSGNFEVSLNVNSMPRPLNPDTVTQYSVKRGQVTVIATDVHNPTLTAQATFTLSHARTTYVEVNTNNGQINIVKSTSRF